MIWQEKIDAALDARRVADALRRRYPVAQGFFYLGNLFT